MPRLFTGIQLPSTLVERLAMLASGLAAARWIEPENYHVTLNFIGDVDNRQADAVMDVLSGIDHPPFQLSIDGLDVFGTSKPRTLYAHIAANAVLDGLQQKQATVLHRLGLVEEARKYVPHVTLARFRGARASAIAPWLAAHGGFLSQPFEVSSFALYSAREKSGGGPYIVEQCFPLRAQVLPAGQSRPCK